MAVIAQFLPFATYAPLCDAKREVCLSSLASHSSEYLLRSHEVWLQRQLNIVIKYLLLVDMKPVGKNFINLLIPLIFISNVKKASMYS